MLAFSFSASFMQFIFLHAWMHFGNVMLSSVHSTMCMVHHFFLFIHTLVDTYIDITTRVMLYSLSECKPCFEVLILLFGYSTSS